MPPAAQAKQEKKIKAMREFDRGHWKASVASPHCANNLDTEAATHLQRDSASPTHWIKNDVGWLRFTQPIKTGESI